MPIYLKLDGVRGQSKDPSHLGWLEISSYQFDRSQSKNGFHDIYLTSAVDSTAQVLYRMSANGDLIASGELHAVDEKNRDMTLVYKFTEVVVTTQLSVPARAGAGPLTQFIHINFKKGEMSVGVPDAQPRGGQADDSPFYDLAQQTGG